jgi:transcriptional regulator with XRE-family HTH domain
VLRKAADLRAAGNAWEAVADAVGLSPGAVRRWPQKYPAPWRAALEEATRRTLAEATAEAVTMLRRQLRSPNEKAVREAAQQLVQIRVALDKARPPKGKTPSAASADPPAYAQRLVNYVRGLTHEQLAAACAEAPG